MFALFTVRSSLCLARVPFLFVPLHKDIRESEFNKKWNHDLINIMTKDRQVDKPYQEANC